MTDTYHLKNENEELKSRIKVLEEEIKTKELIENRLVENERFYKYLFSQISIPYESLNPKGEILDVNQAWLDLMKIKNKKDVIGKSITKFIHPDSISVLQENFPRFLKNGFVRDVEFHLLKSTGEDFYIKNNGIINYKPDGKPKQTFCLFHDITETKRIEKLLYDELELSKKLINSTPNIIYIYDLTLNKNITINDRVSQILEYSKEEVEELGDGILKHLMHPEDYKNYLEKVIPEYASLPKDEFIEHTYRMRKKNGDYLWILSKELIFKYDKHGKPLQIFGIAEDVSEKVITEKKLIESEEKYRNLVERANDGICIIQNRKIMFANTKFVDLWGNSKEELLGLEFTSLLADEEVERVDTSYKLRLAGKNVPQKYESIFKNAKGEHIDIEINAGMIEYKGSPANLVLIHDIRDRKNNEKKILEQMNDLSRSNKLMVLREHKMIELKQEINELRANLGKEKKYSAPEKSKLFNNI